MAKKEDSTPKPQSRQLYEMSADEMIALIDEKGADYREKSSKGKSDNYFADFSDDELFNLFYACDFIYKSDYAVKNELSKKLANSEDASYIYEASYIEMQTRLGSELYGPEYIMNL